MIKQKYPIGTKIRFLYKGEDTNKVGVLVAIEMSRPYIYLPTADKHIKRNHHPILRDGTKYTWGCGWNEIEPLKKQQLMFSFMYD